MIRNQYVKLTALLLATTALPACSGSTMSDGPPPPPPPPPPLPTEMILGVTTDDVFEPSSQESVQQRRDAGGDFSLITAGQQTTEDGVAVWSKPLSPTTTLKFDGEGNAQLQISFADDETFRFEIPSEIVLGLLDSSRIATPASEMESFFIQQNDSDFTLILDVQSPYVTSARITVSDTDNIRIGSSYFIFGLRTADDAMPLTGSAVYRLSVQASKANNTTGEINGFFSAGGSLEAAFGTGEITISFTDFLNGAQNTLEGTGQIFEGTSSFEGTLTSDVDDQLEGSFAGTFFGPAEPNPLQVAGTFSAVNDQENVVGSFVGTDENATLDDVSLVSSVRLSVAESFLEVDTEAGVTGFPAASRGSTTIRNDFISSASIVLDDSGFLRSVDFDVDDTVKEGSLLIAEGDVVDDTSGSVFTSRYEILDPGAPVDEDDPDFLLNYTTFGRWLLVGQGDASNIHNELYSIGGRQTVLADLPTAGTATYDVAVVGSAYTSVVSGLDTDSFRLSGRGNLLADFDDLTVSGEIGTLTGVATDGSGESITIDAFALDTSITFSGLAEFSGTASGVFDGSDVSGDAQGGFFGPNGEEIGGTWNLTDPDNPDFAAQGALLGIQGDTP